MERWTQISRNIKCHKTMEKLGLAISVPNGFELTKAGMEHGSKFGTSITLQDLKDHKQNMMLTKDVGLEVLPYATRKELGVKHGNTQVRNDITMGQVQG